MSRNFFLEILILEIGKKMNSRIITKNNAADREKKFFKKIVCTAVWTHVSNLTAQGLSKLTDLS